MLRKEIRFYITIIFGYSLLLISLFVPPVGVISTSALYGAGMFLILSGATIGIDIPAILKEVRLLRAQKIEIESDESEDDDKK